MSRTTQLARLALLTIVTGGVAAGTASADITLQNPATFDVYEGTPGPELLHPRVLTGDLNRDGIADALGGSGGSGLRLALGGPAGPGAGAAVPGSSSAQAAALGDLDRDGDLDLLQIQSGGLAVSLGDGNGAFAAPVPGESLSATCHDVALGDLDRDGDLDAVAACGSQMLILRGNGAGVLTVGQYQALTDGIDAATHVEVVDWDRDGKLDVIVNDSSDGEVGFHRGNGDGTLAATYSLGHVDAFADMVITDMGRNGVLDMVTLPGGGNATMRWNQGRTSDGLLFAGTQSVSIPHGDATAIDVADLDHDGQDDLVIAGPRGVLVGRGEGSWFRVTPTPATPAWTTAMALGDVDGDRRTDVVLLGRDGDELQVARNVTPERPAPNAFERIAPEPGTNSGPGYTTSADLNRDGVPDLIVAQQTASRVGVFLGNGNATFGARGDFWAGGNSPSQVVPADMNRDGIPDLVVGHGLSSAVGVLPGVGDGTFGTATTRSLSLFNNAVGVAVGDFDRDGIPDVATANGEAQRSSFLRGNGDGTLAAPTHTSTGGGNASAIAAGDFDRDGKLDLAVTGEGFSARLNLLRGNGDGTFQASTVSLGSGSQPLAIRSVDLDRDGDLDLVIANYGTASVSVLRNVGAGFAAREDYPLWGNPRGLDVGDVDGDRIPDVVASDGTGNTVGLLRGVGDGTLAPAASHTVGPDTYGLVVADFDRDGRAEIAAPSYTQQTVKVLRSTVDAAAPTTSDDVPSGWSPYGRVTLTAGDTGGAGVDKTYYTVGTNPADPTTSSDVYSAPITLGHGERIKYFSVDRAGNAEAVRTSAAIKVDGTAPVSTASFAAGWQNAPVEVTLSATDAVSGVHEIRYTIGASPGVPGPSSAVYDPASKPTLAHGQRIRFRAVDVAGNVEASKPASAAAQVDTVAPTVTDDVTDAWRTSPVPVTLTPADTGGSGVAATHYEIGSPPAAPTTSSPVYDPASRPTLDDGQQIRFVAYDTAGNASSGGTSVAARVDGVAPATTDDVPAGWRTAPVAVTLEATDARSGVAATYYEVGASPAEPTTSSPVYDPANKPTLDDGERIAYRSADVAGNLEPVRTSDAAMVDTVAPDAPTLIAGPPAADPATTASIAFAGEPDARFVCAVDGGPAEPCTSPLTLTDLALGDHEVRIAQVDPAEHRSPALVVRFAVTARPVEVPPVVVPPVVQPPVVLPAPTPSSLRAILGDADGAGRRPVVLVAGQRGIACATDRGVVTACRLEARSVRRLTTASGRRLPVGTVLAVGTSTAGVAAGERLATDLRLTTRGRAARATHPLGLTARLVVTGTTAGGTTVRSSSLIRLMTSDTLVIPLPGRSPALSTGARTMLGRLVRTVGGQAKAVRCTADTDRSRDAAADRALTVAQARAACRYLAARGLKAERTSVGRGSTRPRASNRTDRGRALNRRLTVRITL
jgi:hypothetical protein